MRSTSFVLNFLLTHPLIFSGSCVSFCGVPSRCACSPSNGVFQCPAVPPLDATGQRFLNVFFLPLHQRQGLKSLKSTWFTVRGCIPTLKCFRIISHLLSCCLGFVWRRPTRWAALSLIFWSTIRFATVHGLVLMKPGNKSIPTGRKIEYFSLPDTRVRKLPSASHSEKTPQDRILI